MTAQNVTLTIAAADVDWIRTALVDSATVWHQHWRDAADGASNGMDAESCRQINRRQWRLYQEIGAQIGA
jgi:hypothetical protein